MAEVVDLTMLSGSIQNLEREVRLLRLQLDQFAGTTPPRLAVIEQSFHELVTEVARGFGQTQQQITRLESRIDGVDAGLAALRGDLAVSTESIIQSIRSLN